ncbi:hypothetical protein IANJMKHF_00238 [Klebsiella phage CPRSA]|nr:hypothetical protein IANJMKHF_00238 [Klebsiella phage CPRSA]
MIKHPYCLVTRPVSPGGLPVTCWQLIEKGDAFLNKRGENVFVYGVNSSRMKLWLSPMRKQMKNIR